MSSNWSLTRRLLAAFRGQRSGDNLGETSERLAEKLLRRKRYQIVARRARSLLGEIDLVAIDGRVVVFVEVKSRHGECAGHPGEAVDRDKQARLTRAALGYLKRHGLLEHAARFDVVAVAWPANGDPPATDHIVNAFEPIGQGQMFS